MVICGDSGKQIPRGQANHEHAVMDYEPSDEELIGLSKRAFAGLKDAEDARLQRLRNDIAQAREEALARFARGSAR